MFDELAEMVTADLIAPDLPGHGGRNDTGVTWDRAIDEIAGLIESHRPDVLVGYSMGGRLSLGAVLDRKPATAPALVLVSAGFGLATADTRAARRAEDEALAARLEETSLEEFIAEWEQLGAIGGHHQLAAVRRRNTAAGLAAALRGFGQGAQPYLGDRLHEMQEPSAWMAGANDPRYVAIARHAAAAAPGARLVIVPHARHNVIAAAPRLVADVVNDLVTSQRSA